MSPPSSRISELAAKISRNTAVVDKYIKDNNLPPLSFDVDAPIFDGKLPADVEQARVTITDATIELKDLVNGHRNVLKEATINAHIDIDTVIRFDIVHKIPLEKNASISYADLAKKVGVNEGALKRVLRQLIAYRVFREPQPGYIGHSVASRLMAEEENTWAWVQAGTKDVYHIPAIGRALERWPEANEQTQTAATLQLANGEPLTFYQILEREPERHRRFEKSMATFQKSEIFSLRHLVDGYDWAALPQNARVVDLGGSLGETGIAVTAKFPNLTWIVQDVEKPKDGALSWPQNSKIELQVHSFFDPQPVKGADVYLLRWIVHNWPDKYAVKILQQLVPALKAGSRILIMDGVMPRPGEFATNAVERHERFMDLMQLALFNAGDREEDGYRKVFAEADSRFKVSPVKRVEGSALSLIEAVWEG